MQNPPKRGPFKEATSEDQQTILEEMPCHEALKSTRMSVRRPVAMEPSPLFGSALPPAPLAPLGAAEEE